MGKIRDLLVIDLKFNPKKGYDLKSCKCEGTFKNNSDIYLGKFNREGKEEDIFIPRSKIGKIGVISPVGSLEVELEIICKKKHTNRNIEKLTEFIKNYYNQMIGFHHRALIKCQEDIKKLEELKESIV